MDSSNAVKTALDALRESQTAVEAALSAFERQDLSQENARLRETAERLRAALGESREETEAVRRAHEELTRDFKHELASKRLALLDLSGKRHRAYLAAGLRREQERIAALYGGMQTEMDGIQADLDALEREERKPLAQALAVLEEQAREQAERARKRTEEAWFGAANRQSEALDALLEPPIEDAALEAVRRFFQWETFLGLKIISAAGALMILFGVFTFGRYLYDRLGPALQCAAIFALGLALTGAGEALFRKKWRGGFTLALTAGGSGVLFLGAALGYMTLDVLPMGAALGLCAGISLLTFAASLRYNAQFVAVMALTGGYLPLFAMERGLVPFGAVYFTVLSLLTLLIATRKNWRVTRFIGLFAGMLAELGLLSYGYSEMTGVMIGVGFAAYLIIPVFGAWFTKTRVRASDIVLLAGNIFFRFLLLWLWIADSSLPDWSAAAFFTLCCIVMALVTERPKPSGVPVSERGSLRALFFITSVTFAALTALFALESVWFSVGWLVQAAGLGLYGIFKNRRRFCVAASVIGVFCLFAFLFVNVYHTDDPLFVWQYLSVTATAAVMAVATLKVKAARLNRALNLFRAAAAFNLWLYVVYALHGPWNAGRLAALSSITAGFALAFLLPRVKPVYNKGFQAAAVCLGAVNTVWLLHMNTRGLAGGAAALALYVVVNLAGAAWVNDLLRFMAGLRKLPLAWYPLLISGFAVLLAAQNLVVRFSLEAESLLLTLLFGLTALGWVLFGFLKRNGLTRVSGLAMSFFAVLKLFVLDLRGLDVTWRIVCYFTAGAVLLAISFTYQWFSKRLSLDGGGSPVVE